MNRPTPEQIADHCVAELRKEQQVSDEDAKELKAAILENIRLTGSSSGSPEYQASVNAMNEIMNRIKNGNQ